MKKFWAWLHRSFVTDCPKCHKHFYGHQNHHLNVKIKDKTYRILCDNCHKENK